MTKAEAFDIIRAWDDLSGPDLTTYQTEVLAETLRLECLRAKRIGRRQGYRKGRDDERRLHVSGFGDWAPGPSEKPRAPLAKRIAASKPKPLSKR